MSIQVVSFSLHGKMAHFRKYYSNSSALSYSIPPRTTIVGILAGLLGYERDKYYDDFSLEQCKVAVMVRTPIKKIIQTMNLLMIKSQSDLNGSQENHSQTATEFILPQNIRTGEIEYQIWVHHTNSEIMEKMKHLLNPQTSSDACYSLGISVALGTANHLGWLSYHGVQDAEELQNNTMQVGISSVIPIDYVQHISFNESFSYRLVKEDIPLEFENMDSSRKLSAQGKKNMVINLHNSPIYGCMPTYVHLNSELCITWMQ